MRDFSKVLGIDLPMGNQLSYSNFKELAKNRIARLGSRPLHTQSMGNLHSTSEHR